MNKGNEDIPQLSKTKISRRRVLECTAALGVTGIAAGSTEATDNADALSSDEFAAPDELAPLGMLDQRFPITYQNSIPDAVRVITNYFAALSQRDVPGMAACLHFPFASYEGVDPEIVNSEQEFKQRQPASMSIAQSPERWAVEDGYMKPGSYDVFGDLEVITCDPVNVCIALTYYRYGPDGKRILRSQGIYAVTNNDGRWAIQLISTIMTPADMMHIDYPDTAAIASRLRINHDLTYQYNDDAYDADTYQYGTIASVTNEVVQVFFQRLKNMDPYRVKGVKSRLSIRESKPENRRQRDDTTFRDYRAQFRKLGVGNFGFVFGVYPETRVLHCAPEKAHIVSGAIRYTAAGEEINYNRQLYIVTLRQGRWGISGSFSYVSPHDRANDIR